MHTQTIILKGGYVICPADWYYVIPDGIKATECEYAGVIEVRNSDLHGINGEPVPHFIYPSPYKFGRDFTNDFEESVRKACRNAYKDFERLEKLEPSRKAFENVDWHDLNEVERVSELTNKLPQIGFFALAKEGDGTAWSTAEEAPFGVIIRAEKGETT